MLRGAAAIGRKFSINHQLPFARYVSAYIFSLAPYALRAGPEKLHCHELETISARFFFRSVPILFLRAYARQLFNARLEGNWDEGGRWKAGEVRGKVLSSLVSDFKKTKKGERMTGPGCQLSRLSKSISRKLDRRHKSSVYMDAQ